MLLLSNEFINNRYLEKCIAEDSEIRKASAPHVISKISENIVGKHLAFKFVRDNWETVFSRYVNNKKSVNHWSYIFLHCKSYLIVIVLFLFPMSRYEKALKLKPIMDVMQNRNTESSLEEVIILVE